MMHLILGEELGRNVATGGQQVGNDHHGHANDGDSEEFYPIFAVAHEAIDEFDDKEDENADNGGDNEAHQDDVGNIECAGVREALEAVGTAVADGKQYSKDCGQQGDAKHDKGQ